MRGRRGAAVCVAMLLAAAVLAGCSSGHRDEPAPLTDAQAEQLSLARFTTYQLGTVALDTRFTMDGTATELAGWVDFPAGVAYAEAIQDGVPRNLLIWTLTTVALKQTSRTATTPPLPQPPLDGTWGTATIHTAQSELQQILVVILSLGDDRPDNAELVRQNGARYLRNDRIGGQTMTVYAVPPNPTRTPAGRPTGAPAAAAGHSRSITYWIDTAGAIRRAAFTLASGVAVTVDLTAAPGPQLRDPFPAG